MFSPTSIVKNSLLEESTSLNSLMSTENTPEPNYEEFDIETAISEKIKVQHRSIVPTNPSPNTYYHYHTVFKDITNVDTSRTNMPEQLEPCRTFARLNADRLRTITSSNLSCDNLIAPKEILANALVDHIYKVTNQKPSTSKIDEILTNKLTKNDFQKENQIWPAEDKDTGQDDLFSNYFTFE